MTINSNLMNAILSMDAYNRGYNAAIEIYPEDQTDNKFLGTAKIVKNSSVVFNDSDQAIGFYALAYQIKDSSGNVVDNVIAYRGTDGPNPIPDDSDVTNGWLLGAGNYNATQGTMAVNFYKEVAKQIGGADVDLQAVNISTTGHSLGGGFAGFIAVNDNNQDIRKAA